MSHYTRVSYRAYNTLQCGPDPEDSLVTNGDLLYGERIGNDPEEGTDPLIQ